jgi:hypothetical protein
MDRGYGGILPQPGEARATRSKLECLRRRFDGRTDLRVVDWKIVQSAGVLRHTRVSRLSGYTTACRFGHQGAQSLLSAHHDEEGIGTPWIEAAAASSRLRAEGSPSFVQPLGHTLRGVYFDGSSFDANLFFAHVFLQPFVVPAQHIALNLGWRIAGKSDRWDAKAPELLEELGMALQHGAVLFLRGVVSPLDVVSAARSLGKEGDVHLQKAIAYSRRSAGRGNCRTHQLDPATRTR